LEILNQLGKPLKERLRKQEIFTYYRINKVPSSPSPTTKEVHPPPVHDMPPQPMPTNEDLHLNIDVPSMIGNMNMVAPMVEM
jgi:hypothetical protein